MYEIESGLDDFNRYKPSFAVTVQCTVRKPIDFGEIDEHIFIYNREAQRLLNTIIVATSIHDIGMEMTLFCGLLEHLSESGKKDPDVIREKESSQLFKCRKGTFGSTALLIFAKKIC